MKNTLLSGSSIIGTDVKNHAGDDLGKIKDLMIDTASGEINYAVLSFGGFIGMGDKYFAVPWSSFTINRLDETFLLDIAKERLEEAPGFDKDNWPDHASSYLDTVGAFYSNHSPAAGL